MTTTLGNGKYFAMKGVLTSLDQPIEFLSKIFELAVGYSSVDIARLALCSSVLIMDNGLSFRKHPLVQWFMKVIYVLITYYLEIKDLRITDLTYH